MREECMREAKEALLKKFGNVLIDDYTYYSVFYHNGRRYRFVIDFSRDWSYQKDKNYICDFRYEFTYFFDYGHPIFLGCGYRLYTYDVSFTRLKYHIDIIFDKLIKKLSEKNQPEPNNWKVST